MNPSNQNPTRHAPGSGPRLLGGLSAAGVADPSIEAHLDRHGPSPLHGFGIVDELEASGLVGHGGAWFPVATKWRSVANASRRRPVVVANGAEGEPASRKDSLLLSHAPHLVLDGLAIAADALRAHRAIVYVPAPYARAVHQAVGERRAHGIDDVHLEVVECPHTYLAGQETAVVNQLGGRRGAIPSFQRLTPIRERGVDGRPTLVQNVETLAHVALIARYGAGWFRGVGTQDNPGTMLMTVTRASGPVVVEAALGSSLRMSTGITKDELATTQGVLLGGYGGGWVSASDLRDLEVSEKAARRLGASLGAGVVALLPKDVCPLAEMAGVVRYMEGQGAGQCGPCVHGLRDLAVGLEKLAYGAAGSARLDHFLEVCNLIDGRGACGHPDGVARFVRSGLQVFAAEVGAHERRGACTRTSAPRVLPGVGDPPNSTSGDRAPRGQGRSRPTEPRRLVSRA